MAARVEITGADALKKALRNAGEAVHRELGSAVEAEAEAVVQDARGNVRQDTGDLAGSITAQVDGLSAEVRPRSSASSEDPATLAIKANVNEFGRTRDDGQPYMTPAAEASRARWPKRVEDAARQAIKGA